MYYDVKICLGKVVTYWKIWIK